METTQTPTRLPLIGDKAPDFLAQTTHGPLQFSEWAQGKWVILFSHPADFTPVCTTELSAFAEDKAWYEAHDCKLLGLSIDSIHSHIAWVQAVRVKTGVYLDFPIIADLDMSVAKAYGMLQENASATAAVRAVFFIDPTRTVRLLMYYPLNVGRNMAEVKRVLEALQTADTCKCALPVNWVKGDKVIVPPPKTLAELDARLADTSLEFTDFYLARRSL